MSSKTTLVLGGTRSGKSDFAENLILETGKPAVYVATGQAVDDEMKQRIIEHQRRRGAYWETIEEPSDICSVLKNVNNGKAVLIDCLTIWVSTLMHQKRDIGAESQKLCYLIKQSAFDIVLVSNEVGLGIVPDNKLARAFRDHAGTVNRQVANACDNVVFVAAGLPLVLKGNVR